MEVLIDVLPMGPCQEKTVLGAYLESLGNGEEPVLVTLIDSPEQGELGKKLFL